MRYLADLRSIAYLLALPLLAALLWFADTFHPLGYALLLSLAFAVPVIHHNHAHMPIWRSAALNRLTDSWLALLQGHPGYMFDAAHVQNHHRYVNGPGDRTRITQGNSLLGFLTHPLEYIAVMAGWSVAHIRQLAASRPREVAWIALQYFLLIALDVGLALVDWRKTLLFVVAPQLVALFFLFASNYLQHAETDSDSRYDHSRNFTGLMNPLFFNVGLHTAHHNHAGLHWSELPAAHARIAGEISSRLLERGCWRYCFRRWILGRGAASRP